MKIGHEKMQQNHSEESQDFYTSYLDRGVTKERMLTLGYVGIANAAIESLPIEKRNAIVLLWENLQVVLSEAMKSKDERDVNKMLDFLNRSIAESDKFYAIKSKAFLVHSFHPNK